MQRLGVSGAVRPLYGSLGVKGLRDVAEGVGVFCNVGIVLTWGAKLAWVSISVSAVLCGIPDCCLSIVGVHRR